MYRSILTLVFFSACLNQAVADVTAVSPFSGDLHETLDYAGSTIVNHFPLFSNTASLDSFNGTSTAIHYLFSDSLGGDTVTPRTGSHILGFTQGPGIFHFNPPVLKFGGYFNNDSGADGAVVTFYDGEGSPIGTANATTPFAGNQWVWNGWQSTSPISSISVFGNGTINGFLWFDDMELAYTPEPTTLVGLLVGAACLRRRRA